MIIPLEVVLYHIVPHSFDSLSHAKNLMLVCHAFNSFSEERHFWEIFLIKRLEIVKDLCKLAYGNTCKLLDLLNDRYILWPKIIEKNYGVKAVVRSKFFVAEQIDTLWFETFLSCHHLYGTEDDSDYEGEEEEEEEEKEEEEEEEEEDDESNEESEEKENVKTCRICKGIIEDENFDKQNIERMQCKICYNTYKKRKLDKNIQIYNAEINHVRKSSTKCKRCNVVVPQEGKLPAYCFTCTKIYCTECINICINDNHPYEWSDLTYSRAIKSPHIQDLNILRIYCPSFTNFGCYLCLFHDRPALLEGVIVQGGIKFGIKYVGWTGQIYEGLVIFLFDKIYLISYYFCF